MLWMKVIPGIYWETAKCSASYKTKHIAAAAVSSGEWSFLRHLFGKDDLECVCVLLVGNAF